MFFWKLHRGIRPTGSLLIVGPTGCGKTEAFRALSKIYRNIQVADASVITPQGYKGEVKLNSFLKRLDFSSELMPVLVIDEFDKLYTESRFSTDMISYELLKMLEGGIVNAGTEEKPHFVDTSKCAFVLLGRLPLTEYKVCNIIGSTKWYYQLFFYVRYKIKHE